MSQYGKIEFWNERYTKDPEPFDWYQRFSGLKEIFLANLEKDKRILYLGAGHSRLAEELLDEGFSGGITCIDQSTVCVKNMTDYWREKGGDGVKYLQMDGRTMEFEEGSFEAVIDKATLDSVLVRNLGQTNRIRSTTHKLSYFETEYAMGNNIVSETIFSFIFTFLNPQFQYKQCGDNSSTHANKIISQVHRVLSKTGVYIIVSYGQPEYRLPLLERPQYEWTVKVSQIPKPTIASSISIVADKDAPNVHYVYVCRKGAK